MTNFIKCSLCAIKPADAEPCETCLMNKYTIHELKTSIRALEKAGTRLMLTSKGFPFSTDEAISEMNKALALPMVRYIKRYGV